ncbi:MAG: DUF885 domain-containing protein, partial [Sphingobacteriales bacterium]|nr:DUF885 domain-containing protein [Sphingobacteriales bacterium]
MRILAASLLLLLFISGCNTTKKPSADVSVSLSKMFDNYWEDRMKLYPVEATSNGDNRYNDQYPNAVTIAFRDQLKSFYQRYQDSISTYNRDELNDNDRISYDIFKREMQ